MNESAPPAFRIRSAKLVIPGTRTETTMNSVTPSSTTPATIAAPCQLHQSTSSPPSGFRGAVPTTTASAAPSAVAIHLAVPRACSAAFAQ